MEIWFLKTTPIIYWDEIPFKNMYSRLFVLSRVVYENSSLFSPAILHIYIYIYMSLSERSLISWFMNEGVFYCYICKPYLKSINSLIPSKYIPSNGRRLKTDMASCGQSIDIRLSTWVMTHEIFIKITYDISNEKLHSLDLPYLMHYYLKYYFTYSM